MCARTIKPRLSIGFQLVLGAIAELVEFRNRLPADVMPQKFRAALVRGAHEVGVPLIADWPDSREGRAPGLSCKRSGRYWI